MEILSLLTVKEKASLCSGLDNWRTKAVERASLGSVRMSDGPNGLRKESIGENGEIFTEKSTCYPNICLAACCFDTDLIYEYGRAIGAEARAAGVDLLLAPGVNIKRGPLCGRNFEYFSEDPLLSGELAAAFVNGLQSAGTGAVLKHFALNNQEKARLSSDSIADERAKREIYFASFEIAVKKSAPWAVMTAYNKIDGVYASENTRAIKEILRGEWAYDGLTMSDWGGINDRLSALRAGLDLEMPFSGGFRDREIASAAEEGLLDLDLLNNAARHLTELFEKTVKAGKIPPPHRSAEEAHSFARRLARESFVLLKNESGLLPFSPGSSLAVIGEFAGKPRYQGGGAANVRPTRLPSFLDELSARNIKFAFEPGRDTERAVAAAKASDRVLIFAGTPDSYDSEGYDRPDLSLPEAQNRLISEVAKANPDCAVAVFAGSPVEMPWIGGVKAALFCYLPGQAGAEALADCVFGEFSPGGKLPETFPLKLSDSPCYNFFGQERLVEYRESVFVGYRYYDSVNLAVLFPFGHGLSYSRFEYGGLSVAENSGGEVDISFNITNAGSFSAAEAAQVYIAPPVSGVFRPVQELKAFAKVCLQPGESSKLNFSLKPRDFAFYNTKIPGWHILDGEYEIRIGSSSRDIRLKAQITQRNSRPGAALPGISKNHSIPFEREDFENLLGRPVPEYLSRPFRRDSTLKELRATFIGRMIDKILRKSVTSNSSAGEQEGQDLSVMLLAQADYLPVRAIVPGTKGAFSEQMLDGLLTFLNKRRLKGLSQFWRAWRENNKRKD
ncbi:MAG: glycoside hydrolase family 3 C-terminal domain-containing protein [Oscillospiraceae bacterium]|nr:glycoside hydrolase family 3 C-terminal domain-containing protein [Oscillospiraceae bacterium]